MLTQPLEQENHFSTVWPESASVRRAVRPAAWETVAGPALQRVLCSNQSPDVVKSANTSAVRKEFSLLSLTLGGLLLPWAGREGSLGRAAVASCCPYGSGSSCSTTGYIIGNTRRLFLQFQTAEKNEPSAKFSSARGWLCSASLPGAELESLCGRRKVLHPARQPCAGHIGRRDKVTGIISWWKAACRS